VDTGKTADYTLQDSRLVGALVAHSFTPENGDGIDATYRWVVLSDRRAMFVRRRVRSSSFYTITFNSEEAL
jgi:hypothetical protein